MKETIELIIGEIELECHGCNIYISNMEDLKILNKDNSDIKNIFLDFTPDDEEDIIDKEEQLKIIFTNYDYILSSRNWSEYQFYRKDYLTIFNDTNIDTDDLKAKMYILYLCKEQSKSDTIECRNIKIYIKFKLTEKAEKILKNYINEFGETKEDDD